MGNRITYKFVGRLARSTSDYRQLLFLLRCELHFHKLIKANGPLPGQTRTSVPLLRLARLRLYSVAGSAFLKAAARSSGRVSARYVPPAVSTLARYFSFF